VHDLSEELISEIHMVKLPVEPKFPVMIEAVDPHTFRIAFDVPKIVENLLVEKTLKIDYSNGKRAATSVHFLGTDKLTSSVFKFKVHDLDLEPHSKYDVEERFLGDNKTILTSDLITVTLPAVE